MEILFATCRERPALTPSDALLADALVAAGARMQVAPWDSVTPASVSAGLVCLRSTWDYHLRARAFQDWIAQFHNLPGKLWNPPATVLWNTDKVYLKELASRGIPIPATRWSEPGQAVDLPGLFGTTGWARGVLKPRISASAYGTCLVTPTTPLVRAVSAPLAAAGAMLQEFIPEVQTRGEVSLVFLDGAFSHAVRKRALTGEFRVQPHLGGDAVRLEPTPGLRAFGARVLAALPLEWLYARVDVIEAARGPVLVELELIEPELFFTLAPECVGRLAEALAARAMPEAA